jgi:hypothetical protein
LSNQGNRQNLNSKGESTTLKEIGAKNQRKRAKKAVKILNDNYEKGMDRQNVVDILTDLRHLCDIKKIPFYGCIGSSYMHYLAEKKGEPI